MQTARRVDQAGASLFSTVFSSSQLHHDAALLHTGIEMNNGRCRNNSTGSERTSLARVLFVFVVGAGDICLPSRLVYLPVSLRDIKQSTVKYLFDASDVLLDGIVQQCEQ